MNRRFYQSTFLLRKIMAQFLATFGYVGYSSKFPGTMASFVTIFLLVAFQLFFSLDGYKMAIIFFVFSCILSIFVVDWSIKHIFLANDPQQIVLDEVVGMSLTLVVVPFRLEVSSWAAYFVGFVCFRFFDIYKPFPVSFFDSRNAPFFVVLDDMTAAVMSWPFVFLTYILLSP